MSIEGVLRAVRRSMASNDDDWSDRLSHLITSNMLVTAAGIVSYKMFSDGPLECMPPSFFPKSWSRKTNNGNFNLAIFYLIAIDWYLLSVYSPRVVDEQI
ncbi:hypothetical protein RB195_026493 [Necator americanus]|uniref:Innexin n=1 Tax=Necator americanus TaxID=51031 RepID=A0ABR1EWU9_NECAM